MVAIKLYVIMTAHNNNSNNDNSNSSNNNNWYRMYGELALFLWLA